MQIANVQGERREPGNRHANHRLRKAGLVPGVIYGHKQTPETVALSRRDLLLALEHQQHVINLAVSGEEQQYLLKDVQYDHLQHTPIHVDLMRVDPNERVHLKVPVELRGSPQGVHEGGILVHVMTDIDVECPLVQIPDAIHTNIKDLGLGDALHIGDLEFPENVKPLHNPEEIVAVVRVRRGVEVEEEPEAEAPVEAASDEPEVFGRVSKPEDEAKGGV